MRITGTKKLLGIVLLVLLISVAFGYYKLGGFRAVKVELADVQNYRLVGRYFEGSYQSDSLGLYFKQMRSYVEVGNIKGHPAIIYDQEPEGKRGLTKSFIGILTEGESSIQDLEPREIKASKAIRVSKDAHISVMPNPEKIEQLIQDFARDNQLVIGELNIEIYYPDSRLVIERPVMDQ